MITNKGITCFENKILNIYYTIDYNQYHNATVN